MDRYSLAGKITYVILFFLIIPVNLWSQEKEFSFFYQGIDLYPYLHTGIKYIDNVYQTGEKKGDFLITLTPGITAKLPWRRQVFQVDYNLDFNLFTKYTSLNYTNTAISGLADLNLDNYSLNVEKGYRKSYGVTYVEDYVESISNTHKLLFSAGFHLFSFDLGWRNISYDYQLSKKGTNYDIWDRDEQTYILTGYLKIYPKTTSLLGEYNYGEVRYPYRPGRHAKYNLFLAGIKGNLTAKLSGLVKIGYQKRDYQTLKDWQGLSSIGTYLNEKFTSTTEADLSYERTVNESEFTDKNYYLVNHLKVDFSQQFPYSGVRGKIGFTFSREDYPIAVGNRPKRRDKIFEYTLNLGYEFWKLPLRGLTYQYKRLNSNHNEYDYDTQAISVGIRRLF